MKVSTVALAVLSLAVRAEAQIGRTLAECEQKYGKPEIVSVDGGYMFGGQKIPEIHPSALSLKFV
jgi:hypothetical protein